MSIYYVYAYLRSKDSSIALKGTPYYIGKGSNGRAYSKHHTINLPKDKSNIVILEYNLSENKAFYIEKFLIVCYGRIDIGTGILRNRTDGGEGSSGLVHSSESKMKMSDANKGENNPMYGKTGENAPNYGKQFSEEHRIKMSVAQKGEKSPNYGKRHSMETRAKMSAAKKGKIHPMVECPYCGKQGSGSNMKRWHFDNCKNKNRMVQDKLF
jgi:hypothetical protein